MKRLIINCGSSHVSAALILNEGPGKLYVEDFFYENLEYDFSLKNDWLSSTGASLQRLVSQSKCSGDAVFIIPSGNFHHNRILVPVVEKFRQKQIIAHEINQNFHFPFTESVRDKLVLTDDGVEQELLVISPKEKVMESFCERVSSLGIYPQAIRSASMLVAEAFRYTHPDYEGFALLLNIGARSTDLTYFTPQSFFVRFIALEGNYLTHEIAEAFNDPFLMAESRKCEAFSKLIGKSGCPPLNPVFEKSIQAFLCRLTNEVLRTVASYTQKAKGSFPQQVFITGCGSLLPGLADHLTEHLKVPVDYLHLKHQLIAAEKGDQKILDLHSLQLSEILGEASSDGVNERLKMNLIPAQVYESLSLRRRIPYTLTATLLLVLVGALWLFHYTRVLDVSQIQYADITSRIQSMGILRNEIIDAENRVYTLREKIRKLDGLVNSRGSWISLFVDLQQRLHAVEDVWLDHFEIIHKRDVKIDNFSLHNNERKLRLKGRMLDRENPLDRVTTISSSGSITCS